MTPGTLLGLVLLGALALGASGELAAGDRPGRWFGWGELDAADAPPDVRARLAYLVSALLDPLRDAWGGPIRVTSAYRTPEHNAAIGGAPHSQHTTGEAVDVVPVTGTAVQLAQRLVDRGLPYDQLILYTDSPHLHLSLTAAPRRMALLGTRSTGGYAPLDLGAVA